MAGRGRPKKDRHGPSKMVRVPADLYQQIEEIATKYERPVSWQIIKAIKEMIEKEKDKSE